MKNILNPSTADMKSLFLGLCVGVLVSLSLHPAETFRINQRRGNYFITVVENKKIGAHGSIFVENRKDPAGIFKVIDIQGNKCLCLIESFLPGTENARIRYVTFIPEGSIIQVTDPLLSRLVGSQHVTICGYRFFSLRTDKSYYLSESPVALQVIKPADVSGINEILFNIERDTNNKFEAELLNPGYISRWQLSKIIGFSDRNRIFLGTKDGRLGMLYEDGGTIKHTPLSSSSLERFKETMFFYIVLRKRL